MQQVAHAQLGCKQAAPIYAKRLCLLQTLSRDPSQPVLRLCFRQAGGWSTLHNAQLEIAL